MHMGRVHNFNSSELVIGHVGTVGANVTMFNVPNVFRIFNARYPGFLSLFFDKDLEVN